MLQDDSLEIRSLATSSVADCLAFKAFREQSLLDILQVVDQHVERRRVNILIVVVF